MYNGEVCVLKQNLRLLFISCSLFCSEFHGSGIIASISYLLLWDIVIFTKCMQNVHLLSFLCWKYIFLIPHSILRRCWKRTIQNSFLKYSFRIQIFHAGLSSEISLFAEMFPSPSVFMCSPEN